MAEFDEFVVDRLADMETVVASETRCDMADAAGTGSGNVLSC